METVADFIFLGSKITVDGGCSHEIKRCLLLGKKAMTNLDSVLKSRDMTLPTKVRLVKAMVFILAMYGCESWTIKKAKHRRTDAFELWCWQRLLRVFSSNTVWKHQFFWRQDIVLSWSQMIRNDCLFEATLLSIQYNSALAFCPFNFFDCGKIYIT